MSGMPIVEAVRAVPMLVPIRRPLVTATGSIDRVPFVAIDLLTRQGVEGCAYMFSPSPAALGALTDLAVRTGELIAGDPVSPFDIEQKLIRRFRLFGLQGAVQMVLSAIDTAAWDIVAKEKGMPLARLLGGSLRPIRAYNSCGLGIMTPDKVAREAADLAAPGFAAIKVRVGYPTVAGDLAAIRAAREGAPAGTILMCDYNQSLDATEALVRGRALDAEGLHWIEEPIDAHDHAGNAKLAREIRTPVQIGENYWAWRDMQRAIAAGASDYVMPDLIRIGGVSGWLRAAALAEAANLPMSTHLYPEVSVHLMTVTPTAHWLEYVDWADGILEQPFEISAGQAMPPDRPGHGMTWNRAALERYRAS